MSKTDKTIPYWVWEKQNPTGWTRKYARMMYLFPRPKHEQVYRDEYNGKERTRVRLMAREVIKMNREDVDDMDFQNFSTRHSTLWDTY